MTLVKKTLVAAALATVLSAGSAYAVGTGIDFQVQESAAGSPANLITADSFDFSYSAVINQTIVGAFDGIGDTFTEIGNISVSSFKNGLLTVPAFLNGPGQYGLVGTFAATGTASLVSATSIKAIFDSFDLSLYFDTDQNGTGDLLLGTASQVAFSEGNIFAGLANGDFDVQLFFTPTALGSTYFVDPSPFALNMEVAGNNTTVTGASLTTSFIADIDGSGNAQLFVPEPASLALVGLGLLGAGILRRRQPRQA